MHLPLPSELASRNVDYLALTRPTPAHQAASADALTQLAATITKAGGPIAPKGGSHLDVVLSHVDHQGLLPSALRYFPMLPVSEQGKVLDPFAIGAPVQFVSLLNQPVQVQRESMIANLSAQVQRRIELERLEDRPQDATRIDQATSRSDDNAWNDVVDNLRHGWQTAAEGVARQAASAGYVLRVTYQATAVPGREAVAGRMAAMRRVYNELEVVREAVDRFVSSIAPRGQIISTSDQVPEELRTRLQRDIDLPSLRRHTAELLRDMAVTGNGYLAFGDPASPGVYNLKPDDAVDLGDERTLARGTGTEPVQGLHLRGLSQQDSLYGLGVVEVALQYLQRRDLHAEIERGTSAYKPSSEQLEAVAALRDRVEADADGRLRALFALMLGLPERVPDLYFPNRETM